MYDLVHIENVLVVVNKKTSLFIVFICLVVIMSGCGKIHNRDSYMETLWQKVPVEYRPPEPCITDSTDCYNSYLEAVKKEAIDRQKYYLPLVEEAEKKATFHCLTKSACEKAFSLTKVYILNHSGTGIKMADETVILTHEPKERVTVALQAIKTPGVGDSATIQLSGRCSRMYGATINEHCYQYIIKDFNEYPVFMRERMK